MTVNVLFAGNPINWEEYQALLTQKLDVLGLDYALSQEFPPEDVDYVVYSPKGHVSDFTPYTRTKAVLSLWAGVEKIIGNETLTMPLTRMVDTGLSESMIEWVSGHVLRYHLGMDRHIVNPDHEWKPHVPPFAPQRTVAILGLGALGQAVAAQLAALRFDVIGWSRSPKDLPNIRCRDGVDGLQETLREAEIVVTLLPDTPATENTLNAQTLAMLPKGAFIINPGRGPLIDDDALLAALDSGQVAGATLDVFRIEPLPKNHPYWAHPAVTVTPHMAAETRPDTACDVIVENIRRSEAGEPLLHLVDRATGY